MSVCLKFMVFVDDFEHLETRPRFESRDVLDGFKVQILDKNCSGIIAQLKLITASCKVFQHGRKLRLAVTDWFQMNQRFELHLPQKKVMSWEFCHLKSNF